MSHHAVRFFATPVIALAAGVRAEHHRRINRRHGFAAPEHFFEISASSFDSRRRYDDAILRERNDSRIYRVVNVRYRTRNSPAREKSVPRETAFDFDRNRSPTNRVQAIESIRIFGQIPIPRERHRIEIRR